MKQSWSIVVFCYNEVAAVREVVEQILIIFENRLPGLYEIIIVDDGSTDGSRIEIEHIASEHSDVVKTIFHEKNLGIGEALRSGYVAARNENLTAVPADGQFDASELIPYFNTESHTFVSFYRKENAVYTTFRTILSSSNKLINRWLNGITLKDVNWVKIYKTAAIKSFDWKMHSSLIESELCAKLLLSGERVIEVSSLYHPRRSGVSRGASLPVVARAMLETGKLVWTIQLFKQMQQ